MELPGNIPDIPKPVPPRSRPLVLTLACLFAFTWFTLISLLSLLFLLTSGRIAAVRNLYFPDDPITGSQILVMLFPWFLLHAAGLAGTWMAWFRRRTGLLLVVISCIAILLAGIFVHRLAPGALGVNIALIILFGFYSVKQM